METKDSSQEVRAKCPNCQNYVDCKICDGMMVGTCPVCKSEFYIKRKKREKLIRIVNFY